jgi:hypothetical protein
MAAGIDPLRPVRKVVRFVDMDKAAELDMPDSQSCECVVGRGCWMLLFRPPLTTRRMGGFLIVALPWTAPARMDLLGVFIIRKGSVHELV